MNKEIKKWAKSKTKAELVKAITILIEESHDVDGTFLFNKVPYCQHSGECLVESDELTRNNEDYE